MLRIMEAVLDSEPSRPATAALIAEYARMVDDGSGAPLAARVAHPLFTRQRKLLLNDEEWLAAQR